MSQVKRMDVGKIILIPIRKGRDTKNKWETVSHLSKNDFERTRLCAKLQLQTTVHHGLTLTIVILEVISK